MSISSAQALQFVRGHNTLDFLKNSVLAINGRGASPENDYWIYKEVRARNDKSDVFRVIHHMPQETKFRAHTVPMVNRTAIASLGSVAGTTLPNSGADVMVTGMLTACAFSYSDDKKNMVCSHIQPAAVAGATNRGIQLGIDLINGGKFSSGDSMRVFSHREYSSAHHANILGVRRLDGWSLYAQIVDQDNGILNAIQLI